MALYPQVTERERDPVLLVHGDQPHTLGVVAVGVRVARGGNHTSLGIERPSATSIS